MFKNFLHDEEGVAMIEYGLLAALIAVVCLISVVNLGSTLSFMFSVISTPIYGHATIP